MKPMIGAVVLGALAVGGGVVLATSRHPADAQSYQVLTPSAATGVPASVDPTGPVMMPAVISVWSNPFFSVGGTSWGRRHASTSR